MDTNTLSPNMVILFECTTLVQICWGSIVLICEINLVNRVQASVWWCIADKTITTPTDCQEMDG